MTLLVLEKWVRVVNTATVSHAVHDVKGKFVIPPYDNTDETIITLPGDVFRRWQRAGWLVRADKVQAKPKPKPDKVPTAKVHPESSLSMNEIRARLAVEGIKLPVGTTKAAALDMLNDAVETERTDE